MLQTLVFYIFVWWFKKLENRKALLVRAILASIFALIYWIGAIWMFVDEDIAKDGCTAIGIIFLIPAILFTIRVIFDVKKLYSDNTSTSNNSKKNENKSTTEYEYKGYLSKYYNKNSEEENTERKSMNYKKCPKCELNYITDDEELCATCRPQIKITSHAKSVETDFSHIIRGCVYGGNSRKIYEKFCDTLGWDKNKANQFGWQTPLYAANVDKNKEYGVWFIFYPNYDTQKLDAVVDDYHVVNLIQNNGDAIIEVVESGATINSEYRIVFVKTTSGYEFFGVYKTVKNGSTRLYQRICDNYPIRK